MLNVHALIVLVAPVLAWNPIPNHVLGHHQRREILDLSLHSSPGSVSAAGMM